MPLNFMADWQKGTPQFMHLAPCCRLISAEYGVWNS